MCQKSEEVVHTINGHQPVAMATKIVHSSAEASDIESTLSLDPFETMESQSHHNRSLGAIPTLSLLTPKDREYFLLTFLLMFTILIVMFIAWRVKR